jgi:hypothetical protein
MISTRRPTAILRCLRSERVSQFALIMCISVLAAPSAQAGLFDQLKQQATNAIQKDIPHALPGQPTSPSAAVNPRPAPSPAGQANQTPAARPSAATSQVPENPNAVTLVRAFQPIIPSYSGAAEDLLGIRLGMTLTQAEKISSKAYSGDPTVYKLFYVFNHKEVSVKSRRFVSYIQYTKKTPGMADHLLLGFNSPVGDDRLVAMMRDIEFDSPAANEPLVSSIQASLVKKYGTPAAKNDFQGLQLWWAYNQKGRVPCPNGGCFNDQPYGPSYFGRFVAPPTPGGGQYSLNLFKPAPSNSFSYTMTQRCGDIGTTQVASKDGVGSVALVADDDVVRIWANIILSSVDSSKALSMEIYIYYIQPCVDDLVDARSQMKAAAIKRYHAISKTPAVPAF